MKQLQKLWARIVSWFASPILPSSKPPLEINSEFVKDQSRAKKVAQGIQDSHNAVEFNTKHRDRLQEIGPDARITNSGEKDMVLEGPLLRSLLIRAGQTVTIKSPVLEMVDSRDGEKMLREWDAAEVLKDMLYQYVVSIPSNGLLGIVDKERLATALENSKLIIHH